jgi:hypothetical protein
MLVIYRIEYSPESEDHLLALTARGRMIVLDAVEEQLAHQPTVEARHCKLLRNFSMTVGNRGAHLVGAQG